MYQQEQTMRESVRRPVKSSAILPAGDGRGEKEAELVTSRVKIRRVA